MTLAEGRVTLDHLRSFNPTLTYFKGLVRQLKRDAERCHGQQYGPKHIRWGNMFIHFWGTGQICVAHPEIMANLPHSGLVLVTMLGSHNCADVPGKIDEQKCFILRHSEQLPDFLYAVARIFTEPKDCDSEFCCNHAVVVRLDN